MTVARIGAAGTTSLAFALALACCSCSKDDGRIAVFPVHGKVLLDGKPVPHAFVVFHPVEDSSPGAIHPRAQSKDDGTFETSSYDTGDGAPVGEYVVTVERHRPPTSDDPNPGPNQLPRKYASSKSSKLKVHVSQGVNDLKPFELKK